MYECARHPTVGERELWSTLSPVEGGVVYEYTGHIGEKALWSSLSPVEGDVVYEWTYRPKPQELNGFRRAMVRLKTNWEATRFQMRHGAFENREAQGSTCISLKRLSRGEQL